jgi:TraM recognition site of TraD and TraG
LFGLTNVLVMFGGSKDGAFNQEISDLVGQTRVSRRTWQTGAMAARTFSGEDIAIIRPEEMRRLPERHALVIAETANRSLSGCPAASTAGRALGCWRASNASLVSWPSDAADADCGGPCRRRPGRTVGGNSRKGMNRCQASRQTRTVAAYFLPQFDPSKMPSAS